jgi:hypothetical protein
MNRFSAMKAAFPPDPRKKTFLNHLAIPWFREVLISTVCRRFLQLVSICLFTGRQLLVACAPEEHAANGGEQGKRESQN